jgi:hypothetical protein
MYKVNFKVEGISALRFNKYNLDKNTTGTSRKKNEQEKTEDVWERAYLDEKGFYIPRHAIKRCIILGAKRVKLGRGSASASLKAVLIFDKEKFYVTNEKKRILTKKQGDYIITEDAVRIPPGTGARVKQIWVTLPEWQCEFECIVVDSTIHPNTIEESIKFAGLYQGLLDGRPELGRFDMTHFAVKKV